MALDQEPIPSVAMRAADGADAVLAAVTPNAADTELHIRCWGTRGSLPTPGRATAGYGGNTSCVEVRYGARCLILDAGSGIHALGERFTAQNGAVDADLFLTHFHWDHIQGLPFFAPLYDPRSRLRVHGSTQAGVGIETLLAGQMGSAYFPLPYDALAAQLEFAHWQQEPWTRAGVEISALRLRHPGETLGYRIRTAAGTIAYLPDNELVGGSYDVPADWPRRLLDFVAGVDLLIHDAMYTDAEYARHDGWGHSTYGQAVRLAEEAGVRRLQLFHHAPERSDRELRRIVGELRDDLERRASGLLLEAATEGEELVIAGVVT
jgi:phosphoribosyl 1,2-cyclic phosphodiesterase